MDRYYQLLDRDSSTVTPAWKVLHIVSLAIVIGSGFTTAYALGKSVEAFGDNCILYSEIIFYPINNTNSVASVHVPTRQDIFLLEKGYQLIDTTQTSWGSINQCYFCQFTPIMSMIGGILWLFAFLICSRGGAGYITDTIYRPWRIVYPALIFAGIATVCVLISTLQLSTGVNVFCENFEPIFHTPDCVSDIDDYTLTFNPTVKRFIIVLEIAVSFSYICLIGWLTQLSILILRILCIADFQMIRISVTTKDETEMVLKVINPEDKDCTPIMVEKSESTDTKTAEEPVSSSNSSNEPIKPKLKQEAMPKAAPLSMRSQAPLAAAEIFPLEIHTKVEHQNDYRKVSFAGSYKPAAPRSGSGKQGGENILLSTLNNQHSNLKSKVNNDGSLRTTSVSPYTKGTILHGHQPIFKNTSQTTKTDVQF